MLPVTTVTRAEWILSHVMIPLLVVGVIALWLVLGLNIMGIVGHHHSCHT